MAKGKRTDRTSYSSQHLFMALLAFRLANASVVQTYIHPDETWQSLEIAHRSVFGYGYVTWEWRSGLRGFAHPMLFAMVYWVLKTLHLDQTSSLVVALPYVLVAVIAASVDYSVFRLAQRLTNRQVADWALLCSAVSWSMGSGVVRPLVNSAETALTAAAFVYWPWWNSASQSLSGASLRKALVLAALSCIIRPTSGVLWLCAGVFMLVRQPPVQRWPRTWYTIKWVLLVGIAALVAMLMIDRLGYGQWVFPPYQFYRFNVYEDLATWFGESPPLYHLYISMPILFTSMLPFVLHGAYISYKSETAVNTEPAMVALASMCLFSLVGHMEYRFLYPLLPIGFLYAAVSFHSLAGPLSFSKPLAAKAKPNSRSSRWSARKIVAYLLVTNVPAALYLNLVHQRGVVDVMTYLRSEPEQKCTGVGFLMPCHSTPYYSHLHRQIPMWFLSCEPPLEKSALASHYWEADDFEQHPVEFLQKIFPSQSTATTSKLDPDQKIKPSHLVLYDCMVKQIRQQLIELGYVECARFFNTHFSGDSRRIGDVVVFCIK